MGLLHAKVLPADVHCSHCNTRIKRHSKLVCDDVTNSCLLGPEVVLQPEVFPQDLAERLVPLQLSLAHGVRCQGRREAVRQRVDADLRVVR